MVAVKMLFLNLFIAGQLRHTESGIPFRFDVRQDDQSYNQRHYEALGQVRIIFI